jgi:hypothetical protein
LTGWPGCGRLGGVRGAAERRTKRQEKREEIMITTDALCQGCEKPIRWQPGNIMMCQSCWDAEQEDIERGRKVLEKLKSS